MIHTFALPAYDARNIAVALACCMSKQETHYYLNGIALQNDDTLGLMAIATDGHRMGKLKLLADCTAPFSVIMPVDAVTWLGKLSKKAWKVDFAVDDETISFTCDGQSATFKLVNGNFPEWQRTMPNDPQPVVGFSALYLSEIAAAARKTGSTNIVKMHFVEGSAASSPALIKTGNCNLEYVLMPMRF